MSDLLEFIFEFLAHRDVAFESICKTYDDESVTRYISYIHRKTNKPVYYNRKNIHTATRYNCINTVAKIIENGILPSPSCMIIATKNNNTELVKYFLDIRVKVGMAVDVAAFEGNDEVLELFLTRGYDCVDYGLYSAAENGYESTVKLLCSVSSRYYDYIDPEVLDIAAINGHYNIVKFLLDIGCDCTPEALDGAAKYGYLDIVELLTIYKKDCSILALDFAAQKGHLDIVKYLHNNRTEGGTDNAVFYAIRNRNRPMAEYLIDNGLYYGIDNIISMLNHNDDSYLMEYLLMAPFRNLFSRD